ncbi:MAG: hypothetical protein IKH59_10560 [Bacteroidaceae bacterium]|nr:hypothetical protein [Prevotella sp.]MBR2098010.1 hypothetical protein [Prevotella sp.]MBR3022786.1 hypothetical protein [Bacteroidaceae bacterium]
MGQISNYHRFYASFNRLPCGGDREDMKESLVSSYTNGRTTSLREMSEAEYNAMCAALEHKVTPNARAVYIQERKRRRSSALHQLQLYGVDTTDWNKVNAFCEQPRIAGKPFRDLDCEELEALTRKMRAIIRKRDNQQ